MAENRNTGKIPKYTNIVYEENFRLSDDVIGKYISLDGYKKFYNPGTGLDLSVPNTGAVAVIRLFQSVVAGTQSTNTIHGSPNKDAFLIIGNDNVISNDISGTVTQNQRINDNNGSNRYTLDDIVSPGTLRVLNVLESGTYTFSLVSSGNVSVGSNNGGFTFDCAFYIKINTINERITQVYTGVTPAGSQKNKSASITYDINYSKTVDLVAGDYVQFFGRLLSYYNYSDNNSVTWTSNSTDMKISLSSTKTPTQTYFTNPQNLPEMNIKDINFYGSGRDTLKLNGNKLTS